MPIDPFVFFENHPDIMLVFNPTSGHISKANTSAQVFFEQTDETLQSKKIDEVLGPRSEALPSETLQLTDPNGTPKFFDVKTVEIAQNGAPNGLVTLRDVSHLVGWKTSDIDEKSLKSPPENANDPAQPPVDSGAAKANDRKLSEMLDGVSDSFLTLDWNANFTFVNASAQKLLGRPKEELIGRNMWVEFPETIGSRFYEAYNSVLTNRVESRFVEFSQVLKKYLSITAYPTSDGLAIFCRDVTEEHSANQHLTLLEAAVSRINDIVIVSHSKEGEDPKQPKIIFTNEAFERRTGYSREEVMGEVARFLLGPNSQRAEVERLEKCFEDASPARSELINYTKTGEEYWVDLDEVPIKDPQGNVTHWVSVARDITEKKRGEERIALSEERFRLVASATNDVIWDCDLKREKFWWNNNFFKVFGYETECVESKSTLWDRSLHPDEAEEVLSAIAEIIDGTENVWELQYRFLKADGSYAHVIDKGRIVRDETGKAIRLLGSMNDITDRLEMEEKLRQSQKMEVVGQLTGGVAHDFNNLLAIILGNLELLQFELEEQPINRGAAHRLIDSGRTAVKRGAELTNSMLAYARKARLDPEETDLNRTVLETIEWMRRTIESNIEIETNIRPDLWPVRVDTTSLQGAIINLLVNARDALADGGKLIIETTNTEIKDGFIPGTRERVLNGNYVKLSVRDNGSGIDQNIIDQIFTPFFTTKTVGKGSGLGLSMVQGFVRQSGGAISVFSELGQGTRVELYFKAITSTKTVEPSQEYPMKVSTDISSSTGSNRRILIAEDQAEVMSVLKKTLENEGYSVTTARNGDLGLAIFRSDPTFDLILTDLIMPGNLQGAAFAKACREIVPNIPVVFLSGYSNETPTPSEGMLSSDLRLLKPASRKDLLDAVRQSLQMHQ